MKIHWLILGFAIAAVVLPPPLEAQEQTAPQTFQASTPLAFQRLATEHPHVAGVGDSFMNQAFSGSDLTSSVLASGNISLANVLSGQSLYIDPQKDNFTVGGAGMANVLAQTPAIIARDPDIIIIQCCHNDIIRAIAALGPNPSQAAARAAALTSVNANFLTMKTVVANFLAERIMPVLVLENLFNCDEISEGSPDDNAPSCVAHPGVTYLNIINEAVIRQNELRREWAIRNKIPISDWFTPTVAQNGVKIGNKTYIGIRADYTEDNIHPNYPANFAIASQILVDLGPYLNNPTDTLVSNIRDLYDPVNNPYGNLYPNALNYSYRGYTTWPFTGNWPAQWDGYYTTNIAAGKTITGHVVRNEDGPGAAVRIVVNGTGTAGNSANTGINIYSNITTTFSQAVNIECWERVAVSADSPFTQVNMEIAPGGGGGNFGNGNAWYSVGIPGTGYPLYTPGPKTEWSGIIHAPPTTIPPGTTTTIYHSLSWNDSDGMFRGTVELSQFTCRMVPPEELH